MQYPPLSALDHEKEIEQSEHEVDNGQEIPSPDSLRMLLEKDRPGLSRGSVRTHLSHTLLNRGHGYVNSQIEKFPADVLSPQRRLSFAIC